MDESLEILSVILTNRCNLKCVYCGRNENTDNMCVSNELTADEWLNVFVDARKIGLKKVNMTGGEIFCRKDILEIIDRTVALGLDVSIETNGTIVTEEQIKHLSKHRNNISMSISLDGIKEETNDLTRGEGSYSKIFRTIHIIKQNDIPLRIITVLSKNNYEEIEELATTIHEKLGLGFRLLPNIIEYGKGVEANEEHGIQYDNIKKMMDNFYSNFLRKHANSSNLSIEMNIALVPIDIYKHSFCAWGLAMLGIGYSGNAALCHVATADDFFVFDNVRNTSIVDIWKNNEKLKKYREFNPNKLKGVCGNCSAKELCRGGCRLYAITKYNYDFNAPDPDCQKVYDANYFPDYALEISNQNCEYNSVEDDSR